MASINKVTILGRLGQDPEYRMTTTNLAVCTLNVATSDIYMKDNKKEEKTEWHRIILWAKLADIAKNYLKKGRQVYIEGKIQTRSWEDQTGQKRYTTEIIANQIVLLDSGSKSDNLENNTDQYNSSSNSNYIDNPSGSYTIADVSNWGDHNKSPDVPF